MEDNAQNTPERPEGGQSGNQLLFVLLVVLIICGGNGVGILTAGVIWKLTHQLGIAIAAAVLITVLAFAAGMALVLIRNKRQK